MKHSVGSLLGSFHCLGFLIDSFVSLSCSPQLIPSLLEASSDLQSGWPSCSHCYMNELWDILKCEPACQTWMACPYFLRGKYFVVVFYFIFCGFHCIIWSWLGVAWAMSATTRSMQMIMCRVRMGDVGNRMSDVHAYILGGKQGK